MATEQRKQPYPDSSHNKGWLDTITYYIPFLAQSEEPEPQPESYVEGPQPLTAAEVQAHPEYPHAYWDLKPDQEGRIDVGAGRGGPFKIAYQIHGHGPKKIVVCTPHLSLDLTICCWEPVLNSLTDTADSGLWA